MNRWMMENEWISVQIMGESIDGLWVNGWIDWLMDG